MRFPSTFMSIAFRIRAAMELHQSTFLFCFLFLFAASTADLQRFPLPATSDGSLAFLVVGDWGRKGLYNQSLVAAQMGTVGEKMNINFVISTGDNFYEDGLTGVEDPDFGDSFSDIYASSGLQKRWYSVLGNHDYRGDVEAQLSPLLAEKDSRWVCLRSFLLDGGFVQFFMVDTTPFVDKYFTKPGHSTYDWNGVLPRDEYLKNQLQEVDTALKQSTATWKIVIGHHTILSAGQHGVTKELLEHLVPILEENNVDMYINGHDHCVQHIVSSASGIHYVTSGGGSKAWRGVIKEWNPEEMKYYYDGQGFLSAKVTEEKANLMFYGVSGSVLHAWNITKENERKVFIA